VSSVDDNTETTSNNTDYPKSRSTTSKSKVCQP